MFSTTTEPFYCDYQCDSRSISVLGHTEYSTNDYNFISNCTSYQHSSTLIYPQEPMANTTKILINPFFGSHSTNQTSESLSEVENKCPTLIEQQEKSSIPSRHRNRSPPSNRQVITSSKKKSQERQKRKAQRTKFIQEKELIFKRQSSLLSSKHKHSRSSSDRSENKKEKLKRLYKEYSNEDIDKQCKPLLLKEYYDLYQYAFDKYYRRFIDDQY
ncbi:unnamed protein product [Rotaria sordida]|uniref:Uncharacterized protein n=1 Tax=Rotaria sordida TaxID=392033 RepID=A0A818PNF8_9BILA|nr:unnamed protein product [Rotaria sordida]CAF0737264.1 unnamed protein product [Rotaria sordida]CAF0754035.1 unnamed protein product [Rotaria sordida]CAF0759276.1 unnamed protein product [Rotaria sordida]CAF3623684.1 unnamed protein product [Rotaria sordida]